MCDEASACHAVTSQTVNRHDVIVMDTGHVHVYAMESHISALT